MSTTPTRFGLKRVFVVFAVVGGLLALLQPTGIPAIVLVLTAATATSLVIVIGSRQDVLPIAFVVSGAALVALVGYFSAMNSHSGAALDCGFRGLIGALIGGLGASALWRIARFALRRWRDGRRARGS